jgi:hypothetical protein
MKRIMVWLAVAASASVLAGCFGDSDGNGSNTTTTTTPPPPPVVDASTMFVTETIAEAALTSPREPDDITADVAAGSDTTEPIDISTVTIGV